MEQGLGNYPPHVVEGRRSAAADVLVGDGQNIPATNLIDMFSTETKCKIALVYELYVFTAGLMVLLAPDKCRRLLRFKEGWNEPKDNASKKIPMALFNWFLRYAFLASLTHSLFWILCQGMGLETKLGFALGGVGWGIVSLHSILNETHEAGGTSRIPDILSLVTAAVIVFLLYMDSPYLLIAEKVACVSIVLTALQLYLSPSLAMANYKAPDSLEKERAIVHHIQYLGLQMMFMSTLGSYMIWMVDDPQTDGGKDSMLFALGVSLIAAALGYLPLISDARTIIGNMQTVYFVAFVSAFVGVILLVL